MAGRDEGFVEMMKLSQKHILSFQQEYGIDVESLDSSPNHGKQQH